MRFGQLLMVELELSDQCSVVLTHHSLLKALASIYLELFPEQEHL